MVNDLFATGPYADFAQLVRLRHLAGSIGTAAGFSLSPHSGSSRSPLRGRGIDFDEVRPYQPGADIRSIDWRVTARTARAHTKVFREEKDRPLIVVVDQSASLFFGSQVTYKSVMAAQLAALLAWSGLHRHDRVGGIVFNENAMKEIRPLRHKHAVLSLIETLVDYNHRLGKEVVDSTTRQQGGFTHMLESLYRIARPGSAVLLVSDFRSLDANSERLLSLIHRHTTVYALVVADTLEKNLPGHGSYNVTNGTQKRWFQSDDTLSARYTTAFEQRLSEIRQSFARLQIVHRVVWTNDDPQRALQQLMRQPVAA